MAHFLLIHGASHGAWCWAKLLPELAARGHSARAIDLPSHGDDPTDPATVTLDDYVAACIDALEDETVLVGHSLGGLTITLAAAKASEKVRKLVYLCAFVPPPGQAFAEIRKGAVTPDLQSILTIDRDRGLSLVDPERCGPVFYSDCTAEDLAFAQTRLSPQPIAVLTETLDFRPPTVPRHYIICSDDRTVRPEYQRAVTRDWPVGTVHTLAAGHSPFFSHPAKLAELLGEIAAS